jgi:hypothetical protein
MIGTAGCANQARNEALTPHAEDNGERWSQIGPVDGGLTAQTKQLEVNERQTLQSCFHPRTLAATFSSY